MNVAGTLGRLTLTSDLSNAAIAAGGIGAVTVTGDLTGSKILAGCDLGADLIFGTDDDGVFAGAKGNIGFVTVGGRMSRTSIAANVAPGPNGLFGTTGDVVLSATLEGAIRSLIVRGTLTGSDDPSEHFGIVAHKTLGFVSVGRSRLALPCHVGNVTLAGNIG